MVPFLLAVILLITLLQLVLIGTIVFLENRDPAKTIIWLLILGVLPVLGSLLYLVFGRKVRLRKLGRRKHLRDYRLNTILDNQKVKLTSADVMLGDNESHKQKLARVLLNLGSAPLTVNNRAEVLTNGEETFKALFLTLERAEDHIHMEYYIFKDDEVGRDVLKILERKAAAGVKVRVLVDGWGSRAITKRLRELKRAGIEAVRFFPVEFPFLSSRLNLRNHRKLVIVDGCQGFIGGLNVGDEYLSRSKKFGFWRDTFVRLQGESVHFLQTVFLSDWQFVTKENIEEAQYFPDFEQVGNELVQIATSGPDSDWETILQVYFTAMTAADKSIYIETPYFIPDESAMMALKTAALGNLDVRIIFQGVPDHQITYWASHSYFEELLEAGVRIYHYRKGILHAKILIIDGEIGSVGSTNFDIRSFRLNFEISAFIYNRDFAARLEQDFHQDLLQCEEILLEEFRKRPLSYRIKESSARLFSPLL